MRPVGELQRGRWSKVTWVILTGWDREMTRIPSTPWNAQHFPGSSTGLPCRGRGGGGELISGHFKENASDTPTEKVKVSSMWQWGLIWPEWQCVGFLTDTTGGNQTGTHTLSGSDTSPSTWCWSHWPLHTDTQSGNRSLVWMLSHLWRGTVTVTGRCSRPWVSRAKSAILSAMGRPKSASLPLSPSLRTSCSWDTVTHTEHHEHLD